MLDGSSVDSCFKRSGGRSASELVESSSDAPEPGSLQCVADRLAEDVRIPPGSTSLVALEDEVTGAAVLESPAVGPENGVELGVRRHPF